MTTTTATIIPDTFVVDASNGRTYYLPSYTTTYTNADGVVRVRGSLVKNGKVTNFSSPRVVANLTTTTR